MAAVQTSLGLGFVRLSMLPAPHFVETQIGGLLAMKKLRVSAVRLLLVLVACLFLLAPLSARAEPDPQGVSKDNPSAQQPDYICVPVMWVGIVCFRL